MIPTVSAVTPPPMPSGRMIPVAAFHASGSSLDRFAKWSESETSILVREMSKPDANIEAIQLKHFPSRNVRSVQSRWALFRKDSTDGKAEREFLKTIADVKAGGREVTFAAVGRITKFTPDEIRSRCWWILQQHAADVLKMLEKKAALEEQQDDVQESQSALETANAFDVPIDITQVKATIGYRGMIIGEIDQPVEKFTIPAKESSPSPPMDLKIRLTEGALGVTLAALAGEVPLNVHALMVVDGGKGSSYIKLLPSGGSVVGQDEKKK
ncbi:hypothetical protein HDU97_008474 [Phlyctochytrium planicorne]|nr:hypothetical protein HDU97_008474 [Phlyctochytrium planicorne]